MSLLALTEMCEKIEKLAGPGVRINFSYNRIEKPNGSSPTVTIAVVWPNAMPCYESATIKSSRDYVYQHTFDVAEIKYAKFQDVIYDDIVDNISKIRWGLYPNQKT